MKKQIWIQLLSYISEILKLHYEVLGAVYLFGSLEAYTWDPVSEECKELIRD